MRVALRAQVAQHLVQHACLGVGWQILHSAQQSVNISLLFQEQRLVLQALGFLSVHDLIGRLVVKDVFFTVLDGNVVESRGLCHCQEVTFECTG